MKGKTKPVIQTKKDHDYVWTCDYCSTEFSTKKESDRHELTCKNNPRNKSRDIVIRVPAWFGFAFLGIIIFLVLVGLVRAANHSNTQNQNTLTEKPEQSAEPTIITISPTIKPTQKQTPSSSSNTNNTSGNIDCVGPDGKNFYTTMTACTELNQKWGKSVDYMVNCKLGASCGGGTKRIKKSECDNGRCCQLDSGWRFVPSEKECEDLQNSEPKTGNNNSYSNEPKVQFTTSYAYAPGTYSCYETVVNKLLNIYESSAKSYYEMYQRYCENGSLDKNSNDCKDIYSKYEADRKKLSDYIDQFCP